MANWCMNQLCITGKTEDIKKLWDEIANKDTVFLSAIRPMPSDTPNEDAIRYDWRINNWGTKSDLLNCDENGFTIENDDDADTTEISGGFVSAWSPPLAAFSFLAEKLEGVSIEIYYWEPGSMFVGCWNSDEGDDYYDYGECTSETLLDMVPEYLVERFDLQEEVE